MPGNRKKFAPRVDWEREARSGTVVGVPSIFHSDEDGAGEAIGGGAVWRGVEWSGGRFEDVPSPKLR